MKHQSYGFLHRAFGLVLFGLCLNLSANSPEGSTLEGVFPGSEFAYGVHRLKWTADNNQNGVMDLDEAQIERDNAWVGVSKTEFEQLVKRRRALMYMDNAFVYKKTPTRDLELYVDFPPDWKETDCRPAIIWFFGGAWTVGSPFHFAPQADYFARRGVVCLRVDYRIQTVDGIKNDGYTSGLDAKTAVRWVRKNAGRLGIDPKRIMTGGGSAGGHLAMATQIPSMNDPDDDLSVSAKSAALLMHNPYVVRINDQSWVYQIDFKSLPPVWVGYSTLDKGAYTDDPSKERTRRSGETFVQELQAAGIPLRTYIRDEGGHGFCSRPPHLRASTLDIDDFLQECGLLEAGKAEMAEGPSGAAIMQQHLQRVEAGERIRSEPRQLEFVSIRSEAE